MSHQKTEVFGHTSITGKMNLTALSVWYADTIPALSLQSLAFTDMPKGLKCLQINWILQCQINCKRGQIFKRKCWANMYLCIWSSWNSLKGITILEMKMLRLKCISNLSIVMWYSRLYFPKIVTRIPPSAPFQCNLGWSLCPLLIFLGNLVNCCN